MALYGFDKPTALTLKSLARRAESTPSNRLGPLGVGYDLTEGANVGIPRRKLSNLRGYVVTPKTVIPGAVRVNLLGSGGGGTLRVGKGTAYIWQRDQDTGLGQNLKLRKDVDGNPVEVTIYNLCPEDITPVGDTEEIDPADPVLFVTQDQWGDLYIVEKCISEGSSVSSSSSTSESASESASETSTSITSTSITSITSTSASGSVTSTSLSISLSGSVSTSTGASTSQPSTSGECCSLEVVTDVTFDPIACEIEVTKTTFWYTPCGGHGCA